MNSMNYNVKLYQDEEGIFIAECVDLPGCISDGKTRKEAIQNIKEAITTYCESVEKEKPKIKSELITVQI